MIQGIEHPLPPITGFVLTTSKNNPLVEIVARFAAAGRYGQQHDPGELDLRAGQSRGLYDRRRQALGHGLDRLGDYDKFFSQIVRWSMRPSGDSGKFTVATDVQDGKVKVVVTALDKDDEFLNFLNLGSTVIGPDMKPIDLEIKQTAPGRYVGEFDAQKTGSYLLMLSPGPGTAPIRTGVNVPYSDEFRERETNRRC